MNNKIIIALVIVALAFGAYKFFYKKEKATKTPVPDNSSETPSPLLATEKWSTLDTANMVESKLKPTGNIQMMDYTLTNTPVSRA